MQALTHQHDAWRSPPPAVAGLDLRQPSPILCLVDYAIGNQPSAQVKACQGIHLGSVDVIRYEGIGRHRGDRKIHHIREDRRDDYLVTIPLRAKIEIDQGGSNAFAEAGAFVVLSTAKPFDASVSGLRHDEPFSALHVRLSGSLLRERVPHMDRCCDRTLSIRPGAGHIMRSLCELAIIEGPSLSDSQAARLASMLADAVANATVEAPELCALPDADAGSALARVLQQARRYIDAHLSDPGLSAEPIAAHCKVSKRYLQAAFASAGGTIGTVIRQSRLERCRAAFASPQLRDRSITQLAMSWGFCDLAHFSHAYKAHFGVSPSEDRALQLRRC